MTEINEIPEEIKESKPKSKVKSIKKKKITLPISEWSDLEVLTNRIKSRYGATLRTKTSKSAIFEGKSFIVELKKL